MACELGSVRCKNERDEGIPGADLGLHARPPICGMHIRVHSIALCISMGFRLVYQVISEGRLLEIVSDHSWKPPEVILLISLPFIRIKIRPTTFPFVSCKLWFHLVDERSEGMGGLKLSLYRAALLTGS